MSVCLCVCLVAHVDFWKSQKCAHNCAQCIRPQDTTNPVSGSIICPSVCPYVCLRDLYVYSIVLILDMTTITFTITSVGFQRCDTFICTLGSQGPQWGPVKFMCLCIFLYVYLYVWSSASLFGDQSTWTIIVCSAYNRGTRVQTP